MLFFHACIRIKGERPSPRSTTPAASPMT
jgi:hypothetical protein